MRRQYPGEILYRQRDPDGEIVVVEGDAARLMYIDSDAIQSAVDLTSPTTLQLSYTRAMASFLLFHPEPQRILLIGMGGGALVHFLRRYFPSTVLDVVDIRASVIQVAKKYFDIRPDEQLRLYHEDGAEFLSRCKETWAYDAILVDAYGGHGLACSVNSPPFYTDCRNSLADRGVAVFNLWSSDKNSFNAALRALDATFDQRVLKLPVPEKGNVVAFALQHTVSTKQLAAKKNEAKLLEQRLNVDIQYWLRLLRKHNRHGLLARLIGN